MAYAICSTPSCRGNDNLLLGRPYWTAGKIALPNLIRRALLLLRIDFTVAFQYSSK
jgi:hypothetical protein